VIVAVLGDQADEKGSSVARFAVSLELVTLP
jgi:hypothetical protein